MPVGANILCPDSTKKSASRAFTSVRRCATDCAPSTSASAPWRCAAAIISRAGVTVPRAFETCDSTTMRVRGPSSFVFVEQDVAVVVDRSDAEPRPRFEAELLPWHNIGVVLEPGDHDLVAG